MVKPPPRIKERAVVLGEWATVTTRGPEQSIIKWDDGREAIIPNTWMKEEKDK